MRTFNPHLEDEPMATIYLECPEPDYRDIEKLSHHVNRDIGSGPSFVNVYTSDEAIVRKAAEWLENNGYAVEEVAEIQNN